jgi:carbonic anhydrase/acetyltransferase-like protein (isoleucine patch superfamily)
MTKHNPQTEPFKGVWPTVHASAWIHQNATVIGQVVLGPDVSIWPGVSLRGDEGRIAVGAGSNIQDGSSVHMTGGWSHTMVGERVTVGHNVILHGCTVEDDCLIGMGSVLLDGVVVGRGSYIGAGTLIPPNKVIPPGSFVFGNPYRVVRACEAREAEWIAYAAKHYVELKDTYAARDAEG